MQHISLTTPSQEIDFLSKVESNNESCLNVNFNALLKQANENNLHGNVEQCLRETPLVSSLKTSSQTKTVADSSNLANIPPVSSFIKNSEAVLYPSSPSQVQSPAQRYLQHQHDAYSRPGIVSDPDSIGTTQNQHISPPAVTVASEHNALTNNYQRVCATSVNLKTSSPSSCLHSGRTALQQTTSPVHKAVKLCNVKTEIIENTQEMPQVWSCTSTSSQQHDVNQYIKPNCSDLNHRLPAARNTTSFANTIPKQENIFFNNQYPHCPFSDECASLPIHHQYHSNAQSIFPSQQVNFRPVVQTPPPSVVTHSHHPTFAETHYTQHFHLQNQDVAISKRLQQNFYLNHGSHPYMNSVSTKLPATINASIPYRPRYSRRNNPDLEKKRIHKCDHPGKAFLYFSNIKLMNYFTVKGTFFTVSQDFFLFDFFYFIFYFCHKFIRYYNNILQGLLCHL